MVGLDVLRVTNFGSRVAEEELDLLERYFVKTSQWQSIFNGDVDIIYGPKGSGKSAIYSLLAKRSAELRERGVVTVYAENPRGTPAFEYLEEDPPTSERDFISMWKLYFLSLIAEAIYEDGVRNFDISHVLDRLEESGLRRSKLSLKNLLRNVSLYIKRLSRIESLQGGSNVDPSSGAVGYSGTITLRESETSDKLIDQISINELLELIQKSLYETGLNVWVLLDRLDVAFNENEDLEESALRALFRVYRDLADKSRINLKIFLRSDIWQRITLKGFREASHVTRTTDITWDKPDLINLIVRRALANEAVCKHYGASPENTLESYQTQVAFFASIFPAQIDLGERKPSTIDWMLTRVQDGTAKPAPRELIHLVNASVAVQIRKLERGESIDEGDFLISRAAVKDGLNDVSKVRLEQTIYAEYPSLKPFVAKLREERTAQSVESLSTVWEVDGSEAAATAHKLVEIGFFEQRGTKAEPEFWVPFLYRSALGMIQGSAD